MLHEVLAQQFLILWLVNLLDAFDSFPWRSPAKSEYDFLKIFVFSSPSDRTVPSFLRETFDLLALCELRPSDFKAFNSSFSLFVFQLVLIQSRISLVAFQQLYQLLDKSCSHLSRLCIADIIWLSNQGFELALTLILFAGSMEFIAFTNLSIKSE